MKDQIHQETMDYFEQLPVESAAEDAVARTKTRIDAQTNALQTAGYRVEELVSFCELMGIEPQFFD